MITVRARLPLLRARPRPTVEPLPVPPPPRGRDRIARQLALAHLLERLVAEGAIGGYVDAARALGLTRARMSQVMDLALLSPRIQEAVLLGTGGFSARGVRAASRRMCWQDQEQAARKEAGAGSVHGEPPGEGVA